MEGGGGGGGEGAVVRLLFKKMGKGKGKMGTEQRMVVAKGPGLKLGFLVSTVNFFGSLF